MNPARWALRHSVIVNLSVVLILVGGAFAFARLPREIFPGFSNNKLTIATTYPGASPQEVELLVTSKIEEAIVDQAEIDEVNSISYESMSQITVDLEAGAVIGRVIDDVQAAIDTIDDFPEEVEEPVVKELKTRFPVINVSLFGELDAFVMHELAEAVEDDLRQIPDVSQVVAAGVPERVVWVDVDAERLRAYRLSMQQVSRALTDKNRNVPGGELETPAGSIILRTLGQVEQVSELLEIPLGKGRRGRELKLGSVATVREGFEDPPRSLGFVRGRPALSLTVFKNEQGDAIKIADAIKEYCDNERHELPTGVDLKTHGDFSVYIKNRLKTMNATAVLALSLVLVCLFLFLSGRIAFLATLGIPVAFFGAGLVLYLFDYSFNMVAMFSFIVVLGMVVDDAIVLCENVFRHLERGKSPAEAALVGTREVAGPVLCTILTTIAAFLPMLMVSGEIGKYIVIIPIVASITLAFSLFEALLALPLHIKEFMSFGRGRMPAVAPLSGLLEQLTRLYRRLIPWFLRFRYATLAVLFAVTTVLFLVGKYNLKTELFGEIESKQFFLNFEASPSTGIEEMAAKLRPAQEIVGSLPPEELESYNSNVGIIFHDVVRFELGPNKAQIFVDLREGEDRVRDSETIINDLRDQLTAVPGMRKIQVLRPAAGPNVPPIEIGVEGEDFGELLVVARELERMLGEVDGVRDIRSDYEAGKTELQVRLKPAGEALGLTVAAIANALRQRFLYQEATRIHRSKESPEIRVRLQQDQRRWVDQIEQTWLPLADGTEVPLEEVAELEFARAPARIARTDQQRTITVLADVDRKAANPDEVIQKLATTFPTLENQNPRVEIRAKGESLEMRKSFQDLFFAGMVAFAIIYLILASLFRSYVQPLVVMAIIPFALDGVLLGHLIQEENLSMLSMLGFLALAGIVVNDSLVLVSFINERHQQGAPVVEALIQGGSLRVRPILLTSITTIAGLVPLAFFASGQARFLAPMAVSIVWGLTFTTVLTLIVVPCLYLVLADVKGWFGVQDPVSEAV